MGELDKSSYVKFENSYILDRNEFGKPYFITGDDGMKKRIDLYKLILKEGRVELGTVVYYTTEKGSKNTACMPGFKADPQIWEKYFEDIHAIDKEEKNFVLKLSYVLSKELGYQLYRAAAASQGRELSREKEAGTYGNDICFPGDMEVMMAGGHQKPLSTIRAGDRGLSVDPVTLRTRIVMVKELTSHEAKKYAITEMLLVGGAEKNTLAGKEVELVAKTLQATPNHPMATVGGDKKIGELREGDQVICLDEKRGGCRRYRVWYKTESARGRQRVYNMVTGG